MLVYASQLHGKIIIIVLFINYNINSHEVQIIIAISSLKLILEKFMSIS